MAQVIDKRVTAEIEGAFVVFLIGMRINKFWKAWKWLPILFAMPRMLRELEQRPEAGFLGAGEYFGSPRRPMLVQFWRSFEHLETYARSRDTADWPAWVDFNKRVGPSGDVGIWHETYLVPAGAYECVYNNMPPTSLGTVATLVPAAGRKATAASRAGVREEAYPDGAPHRTDRGLSELRSACPRAGRGELMGSASRDANAFDRCRLAVRSGRSSDGRRAGGTAIRASICFP